MQTELERELSDVLAAYLSQWKTLSDCALLLAGVDWDDPRLDAESGAALGGLELLAHEVLEGMRDEADFARAASDFALRSAGAARA